MELEEMQTREREPMIVVSRMSHSYEDEMGNQVKALDQINLTINKGEFVAIIGTNGSVVNVKGNLAYRLVEPSGINYIGLCIFGLLIISFILNRKERMAKISFLWVLFSILVLVLIEHQVASHIR